jgi:hypothetical protein
VIAMPLFVLLVGGIMWTGQLSYDKQWLVIADRYEAWNAGNWHGGKADDALRLFPDSARETATVPPPELTDPEPHWSHSVRAFVKLDVTMPDLTKGWLLADAVMKGQMQDVPGVLNGGKVTLYGRDLSPDGDQPGGHYVIMRSPSYSGTRNEPVNAGEFLEDTPLNVKPPQVANEPWASFTAQ